MDAEQYFNNSSFTTSELINADKDTVGLNTEALFQLMEEYHLAKKRCFKCNFFDRGKILSKCLQHCGSDLCEVG